MSNPIRHRANPFDFTSITLETITVGPLFEGDDERLAKDRGSLSELTCVYGRTNFLPKTLYVREETQVVFRELVGKPVGKKHVLIGSPGVGKSVLCFLAALYMAAVKEKKIVYVRWPREDHPTVFLILPGQNGSTTVQIGSRTFRRIQYSLEDIARSALDFGYEDNSEEWGYFLDGPKEKEVDQLVDFDYFLCTSGGYSTPSDAERTRINIAVMSGWNERDLIAALVATQKVTAAGAKKVYAECGGRMRLALDYLKDEAATITWANFVVADLADGPCSLAVSESESRTSFDNKDRIRTMFRSTSGIPVQIVDSQYLLSRLRDRLNIDVLRKAYRVAQAIDSGAMMGVLFEEIMHNWFHRVKPDPVARVERPPRGVTGNDSIAYLSEPLVYWTPSIPNFANIDAAFVDNQAILHCIQYTVSDSHDFNPKTFDTDFVLKLKKIFTQGFLGIVLYFAVPAGVRFDIQKHDDFECDNGSTTCRFMVVNLSFCSDEDIATSVRAFPFLS